MLRNRQQRVFQCPIPIQSNSPLETSRAIRWQQIRDICSGGACSRTYGESYEVRQNLLIRLLYDILDWWRDDAYALNFLGCCLVRGEGLSVDGVRARQCLLDAGNLGLAVAWHNLGIAHARGLFGEKNYTAAVNCFARGEEMGCILSSNRLQSLEG